MARTDGGDCYAVAGRAAIEDRDAWTVCHGMVTGRGALAGVRFDHAWLELERGGVWLVVDQSNGADWTGLQADYYRLGGIDPAEVKRYSGRRACELMVETGHFGPWEGATE